jgi:hypothetical protein
MMRRHPFSRTLFAATFCAFFSSCGQQKQDDTATKTADTLSYPFKASYSADMTVPSHPEYAQMVLKVWKMFETGQIDAMKKYYADTVTYDSGGHRFFGKSGDLLKYAASDIAGLDSLRFDISMWQSVHLNDRNEDWVFIWARERRYPKNGKPDTSMMHEQWKVVKGKVAYFNDYNAKPIPGTEK